MRVLLDTNIVIHRETGKVMNSDIGFLFKWIDDLHYKKCVHPMTIHELNKYKDTDSVKTFTIKLQSYNVLHTEAPWDLKVTQMSEKHDKNENDINDTKLLNELVNGRVDLLISEDKKIHYKSKLIGINERVFTINSFLEKVTNENPELVDYKILSVKKEYFGNVNIYDPFFNSLKEDYPGFDKWFNKKADEYAYVCSIDSNIRAFLYLKVENENENYSEINPTFDKKKRLKIGTFKVTLNGFKLGERFLKIIFDNAIRFQVDEIYVTIFKKRLEQQNLIDLLEDYGFKAYGHKGIDEFVYVRNFEKKFVQLNPKLSFPYFSKHRDVYITPIRPEYHTSLFPDSYLRTESPVDYSENLSFRNAISKTYITRSIERRMKKGDLLLFYRSGGSSFKSVITTIGVVEDVITNISDLDEFIKLSKRKTVYSEDQLAQMWKENPKFKPFMINFLYTYSLPNRLIAKRLYEMGVLQSAPMGITKIESSLFQDILKEANVNESFIVD